MRIEKIEIKGFRSIYNQTIKASDFNVFVGLNDSGKSNILKALNLFFNNQTGWGEKFNFEHDYNIKSKEEFEQNKQSDKPKNKAKNIIIKLTFSKQGKVIPVWRKEWREDGLHRDGESRFDKNIAKAKRGKTGFKASSKIPEKLNKIQYYYVPAVKSSEFIGSLIGKLSDVLSEKASKDIRDAAGNFEKNIKKKITNVFKNIEKELDITSSLQLPDNLNAIFSQMQFSDDRNIGLSRRGDGIRTRHIPILLEAISTLHEDLKLKGAIHDHFIWGYEEPENNVEIKKCYEMAKQLHDKSGKHQIFLTTHSPAFYSLPLKINKIWEQGKNKMYRYYAEYEHGRTEYASPENAKLDDNFLLPMVSEIIDEKNSEINKKDKIIEEIIKKHEKDKDKFTRKHENNYIFSKPCIFVEGKSDEIIFKEIIYLFFPDIADNIDVRGSGNAGGVSNHLIAWHYHFEQVKRKNEKIEKALGYFDDDETGIKSKETFLNAINKKYVKTLEESDYALPRIYNFPEESENHYLKLKKFGIKIQCDLENLYSLNFWKLALQKGLLKKKSNEKIFSIITKKMKNKICNSEITVDECLNSIFNADEKLILPIKYEFRNKVKAAELIREHAQNHSTKKDAKEYLNLIFLMVKYDIDKYLN